MEEQIYVMKEVSLYYEPQDLYKPLSLKFRLTGKIYGKEGFEEGEEVCTSRIVSWNKGIVTVEGGTQYRVESFDEEYAEVFPEVVEEILKEEGTF